MKRRTTMHAGKPFDEIRRTINLRKTEIAEALAPSDRLETNSSSPAADSRIQ
jgi:hypothetical protein